MRKSAKFPQFMESWRWFRLPSETRLHLPDVLMFGGGLALFYGVLAIGQTWFGPLTPQLVISRNIWSLPTYAGYSLLRMAVAYALSLVFTLVYGYVAAHNPKAERFMIPLLDVLQSIPVLSFLPGVMLAMVALFPRHQIGVELGSILLIFTGQVWNMAFSFYASLKSIPREMRETSRIYPFSGWQRFTQVELPFAAIGLVWNSLMSVAGGWFFLMACEMFVLGKRDFRLPGLGSYLQTAANAGDTFAILWGIAAMIAVIVLLDQLVSRPVIAWAEKFKVEQIESADLPSSWFLRVFRRPPLLARLGRTVVSPMTERLFHHFASRHESDGDSGDSRLWRIWSTRVLGAVAMALLFYGAAGLS
jgi:NitT/TauT family transport system permease protein